jgi:hypothetical protein
MLQMKPSQLLVLLVEMIKQHLPVLIIGGPGIGKTSIVKQACVQVESDLVIDHPALNDPTDAKGFPWMEKGDKHATFKPYGNTALVLAAKKLLTWFLDDLGQATGMTQASYMPWILERRVNGNRLPDCVTIIAATNRRTDRAGVTGILEPVKSRFATIVELIPDLNEWCQWALAQPFMPPWLVAFLRFKPELLNQFTPTADLTNCPLPRTWENAGRILSLGLPTDVESAAVAGCVGEGAAVEALAFYRMFKELPNIDGILLDPDNAKIPEQMSALYAVATALATKATERNIARIARYGERLLAAGFGEHAALLILDAARKKPEIQTTPTFIKLMSGELGQLIGGAV